MKKILFGIITATLIWTSCISISACLLTKMCCKTNFSGHTVCVEVCATELCPFGYNE